jgi:DNA-binding MarR family transcriptional regulator
MTPNVATECSRANEYLLWRASGQNSFEQMLPDIHLHHESRCNTTMNRPLNGSLVRRPGKLTKPDFEALSEFRYQLRRFLRFSEEAAEGEGLTPLQYLLLLHIKGFPGRETATVGELAERLQAQPHGVVALVSRCEAAGLISRSKGESDRRQVYISLTAFGEERLARLAALHRTELQSIASVFQVANISAFNDREQNNAPPSA